MQYKLLASDYDNTLVPFGEHFPPPGGGQGRQEDAGGGRQVRPQHGGRAWSAVNRKGPAGRHPV